MGAESSTASDRERISEYRYVSQPAPQRIKASDRTRKVVSQKDPQRISVLFVCNEWNSSKGGLSTFNRETAINLAKTSSDTIKVHCYVSQSTEQEREDAKRKGVNIITAESIPGTSDPLEWLRLPPPELAKPDIVVGHGLKFGTPAYCIMRTTNCKWIQFVHVFCEDLGKHKVPESPGLDTIEENEKKHKEEIKLCKAANEVVAVGSRLQGKYNNCLPDIKVKVITPGILESFLYLSDQRRGKVKGSPDEFSTFVFGRASYEDLVLKGYDIIAGAVGSLGEAFKVSFVGAPEGQHGKMEEWFLQNTKVKRKQLTIRGFCDQSELKRMFCEADLVAMPSRTEGFGLIALEAISAGVPVLVTSESGIAKALERVEGGKSVIVQSEEPEEWAQKIKMTSKKKPEERLDDAILLRENYSKTYSWRIQCERFSEMIGVPMNDPTSPVVAGGRTQRAPVEDTHITVSEEAMATNLLYEDLPLEEIPWYFGNLNRLSAEKLLQSHDPGTFLVRKGESDTKSGQYVISLRDRDKYQHQKIETLADGKFVLEGHEGHLFPNLAASVQYFVTCLKSDIHLAPLEKEKENAGPKMVARGLVDHNGGKLTIGDTGVRLIVPPQAIPEGRSEGIFIAIMNQEKEHPQVTSKQALLSPVVKCGPSGLKFERPVILSIPHCALLEDGAWNLKVQYNESESGTPTEWKQLIDINKQDGSEPSLAIVKPNMVHLLVDHFTNFAVTGESASSKEAKKTVRIVAYVTPPEAEGNSVVRVYCVGDTEVHLKSVHSQEIERLGGLLRDAPKPFHFRDGGGDLLVKLTNYHRGWTNTSGDQKEIRFHHVWEGIECMPSCTFVFTLAGDSVSQFHATFEVKQDCQDGDKTEVIVSTETKQRRPRHSEKSEFINKAMEQKAASAHSLEDTTASLVSGALAAASPASSPIQLKHTSSGYFSFGFEPLPSTDSLTRKIRNELIIALDPAHPKADWRTLAEDLGYEMKHIRWLEDRKLVASPTDVLLTVLEGQKFPLHRLAEKLHEMGREDAASLIEAQLMLRETEV